MISTKSQSKLKRIEYLDGLRGIAILLVVLFHAYSRWTELVPYGEAVAGFPVFKFGYLGVQLFFLISGFVILMTLERCTGFIDFAFRRWLRLFPGMLICSLLIFFTAPMFYERPFGAPEISSLLPGLVFIEPHLLTRITSIPFGELEGVFWSLYVEARFYLIARIAYFAFGSRSVIWVVFALGVLHFLFELGNSFLGFGILQSGYRISVYLSFEYFTWFGAGSAFYMYMKSRSLHWYGVGLAMVVASCVLYSRLDMDELLAAIMVSALFCVSLLSSRVQKFCELRVLLWLGFISYPLYLLHENMMIASIVQLAPLLDFLPDLALPVLPILMISGLAYLVARYGESPVKYQLRGLVVGLIARFKRDAPDTFSNP